MENEIRDQYWVMNRRNRFHGLGPIRKACQRAGDPQDHLRVIHVAGTNGKGSTVNYIRAALNSLGYKVGTFTSPHLMSHFDRIRIDDAWIEEEVFNAYLNRNMEVIEELDLGMFEIDLLIAFEWFFESGVDYAVIEAGLGGRLDNTNILKHPLLSIITTVGYDHMAILGERLSQIAFEKAGIIKPYGHCIHGYLEPSCEKVIRARADTIHAAVYGIQKYRSLDVNAMEYRGCVYEIQGGQYQKANAALALEAIRFLGFDITSSAVRKAIRECMWKGRFEKISDDPAIILDGAHNEEGIRALCASLGTLKRPLAIVFSALKDKPGREMAARLEAHADLLIVTAFEYERADKTERLAPENALIIDDWHEAIARAERFAKAGTVVITGSLYFISTIRQHLLNRP